MSISFDVKLQAKDVYRFNMYQTYTGIHGLMSVILAVAAWVFSAATFGKTEALYTVLYIVFGFVILFYLPVTLWVRAKATIRTNAVLSDTLHYEISESGIRVTQGEEEGELPWDMIYKMVSNRWQVLIYSNRINAYVLPREQLSGQYPALCELAEKKLEKYRRRLKGAAEKDG